MKDFRATSTSTIFTKLFLTYLIILFLAFLLFSSIFLYLFHINLYAEYEDTFTFYHKQIEKQLSLADKYGWNDDLLQSSLEISLKQMNSNIFILNQAGEIILQPQSPSVPEVALEETIIHDIIDSEQYTKGSKIDQHFIYTVAAPIQLNAKTPLKLDYTMVTVFYKLDDRYKEVLFMIFLTFSITIAFSAFILWVISRRITAPLRQINRIALTLAKGDFSQRVKIQTSDEVGQLGETFNYMAEELEGIDQMRKDFISNVSHDLRSPLTSIKGFLLALLDGAIPYDRKKHYYTLMKDETERLIKLVNDLLEMSQLESGNIEINQITYNVSEQLRLVIAKMEPQLERNQIEINISTDDTDLYVFADPNRIEQVFYNLIENAIQFSQPKNRIDISFERIGENVIIHIQDFGDGIKKDEIGLIWERFYKSDKARSKKVGTGIGLAIVKTIIDLHQSEIHVTSVVGEGTTFSFTLPLKKI